jgi:hypothetical protein
MMILTSFLTVVFPAGFAMEIPVLVRARYLEADEIEAARRIDRIAAPRAEWDNAKCHDSVPFLRTVFFSVGARPILGTSEAPQQSETVVECMSPLPQPNPQTIPGRALFQVQVELRMRVA